MTGDQSAPKPAADPSTRPAAEPAAPSVTEPPVGPRPTADPAPVADPDVAADSATEVATPATTSAAAATSVAAPAPAPVADPDVAAAATPADPATSVAAPDAVTSAHLAAPDAVAPASASTSASASTDPDTATTVILPAIADATETSAQPIPASPTAAPTPAHRTTYTVGQLVPAPVRPAFRSTAGSASSSASSSAASPADPPTSPAAHRAAHSTHSTHSAHPTRSARRPEHASRSPLRARRPRPGRTGAIVTTGICGLIIVLVVGIGLRPSNGGPRPDAAARGPIPTAAVSGPATGATTPADASPTPVAPKAAPIPLGPPSFAMSPHVTVPGSSTAAWPTQGQAAIELPGFGTLGASGDAGTASPIASVAKTMTAYLILRDHPLPVGGQGPEITVTQQDVATYQYDVGQNMSTVPVAAGEQLSEAQALEALMLPSANNIAFLLADWDDGSSSAFVHEMNDEAGNLGMGHTQYTDPSGYDPGTVSTAPDQIALGEAAMQMPFFAWLVAQTSAQIPVAGTIDNYNSLLGYNGVDGIKTGSTGQAGGCLLFHAVFTADGKQLTLVGAVLGQGAGSGQELQDGLAAAKQLVASAEADVTAYQVVGPQTVVATIPLTGGAVSDLYPAAALSVPAWPGEQLTLSMELSGSSPTLQVEAPSGQVIGSVALTGTAAG